MQNVALFEYQGNYPETQSSHGNVKKNQDDNYTCTDPQTMDKISKLSKYQSSCQIYKTLLAEDSFNSARDFKQIQKKIQNEQKKEKKTIGKKDNFADEILLSMQLVDDHEMVQVFKVKKKLPSFILYTENQIEDLRCFLSNQGNFVLGVDRTFNLGSFYVTALVYKNQCVVRKDNPSEHPLFLGPIYLHEANFESYHTFYSANKGKLCSKDNGRAIEMWLWQGCTVWL